MININSMCYSSNNNISDDLKDDSHFCQQNNSNINDIPIDKIQLEDQLDAEDLLSSVYYTLIRTYV